MKARVSTLILLFILVYAMQGLSVHPVHSESSLSIYGRIVDANSGSPIPGATVIVWDITESKRPKLGAGIYFTDENGEYNVSGPYIIPGHTYRIYAYRGNISTNTFDYVPAKYGDVLILEHSKNVSMKLIPGATILLKGKVYAVETPIQPIRFTVEVNSLEGKPYKLNTNYISEYGDTIDTWFLMLNRYVCIVPANLPVSLTVKSWFVDWRKGGVFPVEFTIKPLKGFVLSQGERITYDISEYGLKRSLNVVNAYIMEVSDKVSKAQRDGFYVAEERVKLIRAQQDVFRAEEYLSNNQYENSFSLLLEVYSKVYGVSRTLDWMRFVSSSNAVYLPAFFAIHSVILAFFIFEDKKKKLISSLILYIIFLISLFWIYPGTRIAATHSFINILSFQVPLFWLTAIASISVTLLVIFGLPRVWKEPEVEGRVPLTSAASIIFSMAKRQIRRRKIRGFFTIFSVIILVLAFTSLTSFGTVYGLVSEGVNVPYRTDGVLVKRPGAVLDGIKNPFTALSPDDVNMLTSILNIKFVAPKVENIPDSKPLGKLESSLGRSIFLFGVLGIAASNETLYVDLNRTVIEGSYLKDQDQNVILISAEAASRLGVKVGEKVNFYVRGVPGIVSTFTVGGIFDDGAFSKLTDINGEVYGPKRMVEAQKALKIVPCNTSDIIIMNWQTALSLQKKAMVLSTSAPTFAAISRITFQPKRWGDLNSIVNTLTLAFDYHVYVSRNNKVTLYRQGFRYEAKGTMEILFPLVMVSLNVGAVMLNAVYERRREMEVLSVVGLNPAHMALLFVAEGIVIGMVGGGIGYLFGLGFYRVMSILGVSLMVREKLEWWWSAVGFALAIAASVLSTIRPAMIAVKMYTPSMIRKLKLTEVERKEREKEVFRVYQARKLSMPVKVLENEAPFFFGYVISRLKELEAGTYERTDNVVEEPEMETPKGEIIKNIRFIHIFVEAGKRYSTRNRVICTKGPEDKAFRVELESEPTEPGIPEKLVERTVKMMRDISIDWLKNKKRIMGLV